MKDKKPVTKAIQLVAEKSDPVRFSVVVLTLDGDKVIGRDVESGLNYFIAVNRLKRVSADLWAGLIHEQQ